MKYQFLDVVSSGKTEGTLAFVHVKIDELFKVYVSIVLKKDGGVFASMPSRRLVDGGAFQPLVDIQSQSDLKKILDGARDYYTSSLTPPAEEPSQPFVEPDDLPF